MNQSPESGSHNHQDDCQQGRKDISKLQYEMMGVYTWTQPNWCSFMGVYIWTQPICCTPPAMSPFTVDWVFTFGPSPAAVFSTISKAIKLKELKEKVQMKGKVLVMFNSSLPLRV